MYIPPMFDFMTDKPIDEDALHSWAVQSGGEWLPATDCHGGYYLAQWDFGMTARLDALTDKDIAKWTLRMQVPPQSILNIDLSDCLPGGDPACAALLSALFQQWDGYAYDLGCHDWVSELLREPLPAERIIRYEPPPPGPARPWIWVGNKYVKNEVYHDDGDADKRTN